MATVALLPWGDTVEDFLDPLGIGLEDLRDELTGGWLFGFVEALADAGVTASIVVVSRSVRQVTRWRHRPTGAPLVVLPMARTYGMLRRRLSDPYALTAADSARSPGLRGRLAAQPARQLAPYLATPVRSLAVELRRMRADAILCQEYEYQRFDVCVALGRLLGLPVVATFQGGDATRTGVERLVRPMTMRGARALIVGPAGEAARARRRYRLPEARVARIPNPLDVPRLGPDRRPRARAALGFSEDALVVAWHGRVELHRKGLDVLLGAWALLAHAPGASRRLLLVGTGRDAAALRWSIDDRRLPGIVWIDEYVLDRDRLAAYLRAADVYAFPSRHEGFPVAPLEAMAAGLPVVAADAPGVAEIATGGERAGVIVVPRDDVPAFAAAIAGLLQDPHRRAQLGRAARRRAAEGFSLHAIGGQLRDVLLGAGATTSHTCAATNTPPSEDEPTIRTV